MKLSKILKNDFTEMGEQQFSSRVRNKNLVILNGYGNAVDYQSEEKSVEAMQNALQTKYPDYSISILQIGRFGLSKSGWNFDAGMTASGHPGDWAIDSRGYYALTKNSLFLFPKDESFYEKYIKDFAQISKFASVSKK